MGQVDYVSIAYEAPPLHACPDLFRMKLPEIASKRNRIRDAKILSLYATDGLSQEEIASRFNLGQTTVSSIIRKNRAILNADKSLEKIKRINLLKRELSSSSLPFAKNRLEIMTELRKEIEGENQSGNLGSVVNIYNINGERADRFRSKVQASRLPAENPA